MKGPSNTSHYILSEDLIPRPKPDNTYSDIDLEFDCKRLSASVSQICSNHSTRGRRAIILV